MEKYGCFSGLNNVEFFQFPLIFCTMYHNLTFMDTTKVKNQQLNCQTKNIFDIFAQTKKLYRCEFHVSLYKEIVACNYTCIKVNISNLF